MGISATRGAHSPDPQAENRLRGERGLLALPTDWLLRMRYDPFYALLEQRVLAWLKVVGPRSGWGHSASRGAPSTSRSANARSWASW